MNGFLFYNLQGSHKERGRFRGVEHTIGGGTAASINRIREKDNSKRRRSKMGFIFILWLWWWMEGSSVIDSVLECLFPSYSYLRFHSPPFTANRITTTNNSLCLIFHPEKKKKNKNKKNYHLRTANE